MRFPPSVIALISVALTCASFGRGGGGGNAASGASPEEWSADVCNAVEGFQNDVHQRSTELQQQVGNVTSIAEARQILVDYLDASITRTDKTLDQLEAAGDPAVENGEEIGQTLRTELAKLKPAFQDARTKAAALPDDPQTFAKGAGEIATNLTLSIGEVGGRLDATLGQFDAPELGRAIQDVPACQALGLTE